MLAIDPLDHLWISNFILLIAYFWRLLHAFVHTSSKCSTVIFPMLSKCIITFTSCTFFFALYDLFFAIQSILMLEGCTLLLDSRISLERHSLGGCVQSQWLQTFSQLSLHFFSFPSFQYMSKKSGLISSNETNSGTPDMTFLCLAAEPGTCFFIFLPSKVFIFSRALYCHLLTVCTKTHLLLKYFKLHSSYILF